MTRLLLLGALLALLQAATVNVTAQENVSTDGFLCKRCDHPLSLFLYSQAILWPSSIAGHAYVYITENVNISSAVRWSQYKRTFTRPPVWDIDHWSWNYEVHPIMGSFSYLSYRNNQAHWALAMAGTSLNSFIYEYVIAGGTQQPSLNDLIATPILGSLLGEGIYRLKKILFRDHQLRTWEKIVVTLIDPFEAINLGFNYNKMIRKQYR